MSAFSHGSVPGRRPVRPLRSVPRSRAYWELKADQMMNRLFDPEEPIDLAVEPVPEPQRPPLAAVPSPPPPEAPRPPGTGAPRLLAVATPADLPTQSVSARRLRAVPRGALPASVAAGALRSSRPRRPDERLLLIGTLCGVCLASVVGSLLYFGHWTRLQQSISQERNLLLLERLRSLGPANPSPVGGSQPAAPLLPAAQGQDGAGTEGLPPPPPQEAWIEQLSSLPSPPAASPRVLTVPVSPRLAAAAPSARAAASPAARPSGPLPQLVGVVGSAGRPPSAIFLVGGNSMSVASGEAIGATGWRLRSAEGETALIERGAELRQVSIASGNGY